MFTTLGDVLSFFRLILAGHLRRRLAACGARFSVPLGRRPCRRATDRYGPVHASGVLYQRDAAITSQTNLLSTIASLFTISGDLAWIG